MTGAYRENRCRVYREEPVVHLYRETGGPCVEGRNLGGPSIEEESNGPCRRRNPWWSMCRGETVVPDLIRDLHREDRCGPYNGGTDRTCREGRTFNDTCRQGRTDASCLQERSDNKTAGRKPHVKTAGKPTLRQQDCKPLTKTAGLSNH